MKKPTGLLYALAALCLTACTTEESLNKTSGTPGDTDPMFLSDIGASTRSNMNMDLVNTWADGDVLGLFESWDENRSNSFMDYGKQNAKYNFTASFTYGGQAYTNKFVQEGVLDKTIAASDMVGFKSTPDVTHFNSYYTAYSYFPYVSTATKTSVPFSLNSTQIQTTPNVWSNQTAGNNFTWYAVEKITRPADRVFPLGPNRLLPVAEFNIIRDSTLLDGYYLTSVTMTPKSGTMATGAVTGGIDLTAVSGYNSLPLASTAACYTLDTKSTGNGIQIADANVTAGHSLNVYMSVPPSTEREYTVNAIFSNGTKMKAITVNRSDAFTITNGKGNLVRYYLKNSTAKDFTEPKVPVKWNGTWDGKYYAWDDEVGKVHDWQNNRTYNSTSVGPSDPLTDDGSLATRGCKGCPTYRQALMYLNAGVYYDTYTKWKDASGTEYTGGIWLKKKSQIPGFDAGTASTAKTGVDYIATIASSSDPNYSIVCTSGNYFFLPAGGYHYSNVSLEGKEGYYWLSTPYNSQNNAYELQFENTASYVVKQNCSFGHSLWGVL